MSSYIDGSHIGLGVHPIQYILIELTVSALIIFPNKVTFPGTISYYLSMRQALGPGALGKPRGSGWRGRWEGGSGWGTHVNPWLFHSNV